MAIRYLLYASRLVAPLEHEALNALLGTSQRNNRACGLTGFLHIEDQIVLQYLEGEAQPLDSTVGRIRNDKRHNGFVVLSEGTVEQRYFDGWRMALVESATLSLFDLLGCRIVDVSAIKEANPTDLIALLSANASFLRDRPSVA
ncbi:MAG: BLUF domain-containing protein [Pseudomonadota bacterium]